MTWQDVLTALPGHMGLGWQLLWGIMALAAAAIMFVKMIVNEPFSALLIARVLLGIGLVLIPLQMLQPGWQPWVDAFVASGGFLSAVLIATGWCQREDHSLTMTRAIARWVARHGSAAIHWLAGERQHDRKKEDAL
jgi:hypothetical protein